MANFTHLKALQVTADNVVDFELPELGPDAVLKLRSSNEGNSGYMNGLLRLTGQSKGARRKKVKVDAKSMEDMREYDKELYPEHVIVGWGGVQDADGKPVKFSAEEAAMLLEQLPDYLFDELRAFANDPVNFVAVIDSEEKGKN